MAISHICLKCGIDLARVRPFRDPHYELPLVLCPRCGAAAARRRHPSVIQWRRFWRIERTAMAIVLQLATFAGLTVGMTLVCIVSAAELSAGRLPGPRDPLAQSIVVGLIAVLSVAVGAWLTIGLAHWRRWVAWSSFAAWMTVVLGGDVFIGPCLAWILDRIVTEDTRIPFYPHEWILRLGVLAALMLVAVAGIPAGNALGRLWQAFRRQRWRARRRRFRHRSSR